MEILYLNPETHVYEVKDWTWLQSVFGPGLQVVDAGNGARFELRRIVVTEAEASLNAHITRADGSPCAGQPVAFYWPDVASAPNRQQIRSGGQNLGGLQTCLSDYVLVQSTDANGQTGFGLGTGAYIEDLAAGGPHHLYPLSPSMPSQALKGIGMIGGTVHLVPSHIYWQEVAAPAPGDDDDDPDPGDDGDAPGTLRGRLEQARAAIAWASARVDDALALLG